MKARPRRAENRVADELNKWFMQQGFSPIQRIPIIGRTGPDYTFNELELVIDEKSRLEVPKSCLCPASEIIQIGDNLLGVRIARTSTNSSTCGSLLGSRTTTARLFVTTTAT